MKFEIKKCLSLPIVMLLAIVGCTSSDINNNIPVNSNDLIDTNVVYKSETVKVEVENAPVHSLDKKIEEHKDIDDDAVIISENTKNDVEIITVPVANNDEVVSFVEDVYVEDTTMPVADTDLEFEMAVRQAEESRGIKHVSRPITMPKKIEAKKTQSSKNLKFNIVDVKEDTKTSNQSITFLSTIIYHSNAQADISAKDIKALKSVAEFVKKNNGTIRVVGNSSSRSKNMKEIQNKLKNFELSILRAQKVRDALISQGVPADKIFIDAVADTEKVVEENMPINEAINRRTEVYINY